MPCPCDGDCRLYEEACHTALRKEIPIMNNEEVRTLELTTESHSHCDGCPYPGVGFICGSYGDCMKTRISKLLQRKKEK